MRNPEFFSSSHKKDPFSRRVVHGNITFYFRYQQPDIEPAKFHSPIYTCWLQKAMGQGFHSSPGPLHSPTQLVMQVEYLLLVGGIYSQTVWWQTVCTVILLEKELLPFSYIRPKTKFEKLFVGTTDPSLHFFSECGLRTK